MNNKLRTFCLLSIICISLLYSSTVANAVPTGEIIFVHPKARGEIWFSNVVGSNAHKFFRHTFEKINKIRIQEDGKYVLAVVSKPISVDENGIVRLVMARTELFLLDKENPNKEAKEISLGRFIIRDADMSNSGDVIILEPQKLLLIKHEQLVHREPEAELLLDLTGWNILRVGWAPDGKHIAFTTAQSKELFLLDVETKDVVKIADNVWFYNYAFSPDGKQIAYSTDIVDEHQVWLGRAIVVVPVHQNADAEIILYKENFRYNVQSWSPDGKYIAYSSYIDPSLVQDIEVFRSTKNQVIPATGGESVPILFTMKQIVDTLDWVENTLPVEPDNSLVTTWAKLKEQE